jgi:hypothetical protein
MLPTIFTRPILFNVDALALLGFALIGLGVGLRRSGQLRMPIAISLQIAGAVLVVVGFVTLQLGG